MAAAADSTFVWPRRSTVWTTWRWRFDSSTTSKSTMPIVPTPGGGQVEQARARPAPRADEQDARLEQLGLPADAHLGDQQVPAVALLLGRS